MDLTESCRLVRGRREALTEYLHKLRTERRQRPFPVDCDGMQPLPCMSIVRYLRRPILRSIGELRWYREYSSSLLKDGVFLFLSKIQ